MRSWLPLALVALAGCGGFAIEPDGGSDGGMVDLAPQPLTVMHEAPDGGAYLGVWGTRDDDVWIGGTTGLFHWDGAALAPVTLPSNAQVNHLWGASASDIEAVGSTTATGIFLHFDGSAWTRETEVPSPLMGVTGAGSIRWAIDARGNVYMKSGGGAWSAPTKLPSNPMVGSNLALLSIAASSPSSAMIAGGTDTRYVWDGQAWSPLFDMPDNHVYRAVWAAPGQAPIFYTGSNFWQLVSWSGITDTTGSWLHEEPAEVGSGIWDLWGSASDRVFAVGDSGRGLYYDGSSAIPFQLPTSASMYGVWGDAARQTLWIVGDKETIVHGTPMF